MEVPFVTIKWSLIYVLIRSQLPAETERISVYGSFTTSIDGCQCFNISYHIHGDQLK